MENIILLHGALGAANMLQSLKHALSSDYKVYTVNFTGHGSKALPDAPFSIAMFTQDVLNLMDQEELEQAHIFGYSMGGYVGLYLAHLYPQRIKSVFTVATKFDWSQEVAAHETRMLNPEKIKEKVPHFAATLADRHAPQPWEDIMLKTAEMMLQLGQKPLLTPKVLATIKQPVQVAVGDRDNMVTIQETTEVFIQLPNASLLVLPHTQHPLETIKTERLQYEINTFFAEILIPGQV
jgi:pimeloyl-ACP methyl ester carboxylesterase